MVHILYFGKLSDVTGIGEERLDLPETVTDSTALRRWLDDRYGASGTMLEPTVRIAVDGEIVVDPHSLSTAREIALMPPVGGG